MKNSNRIEEEITLLRQNASCLLNVFVFFFIIFHRPSTVFLPKNESLAIIFTKFSLLKGEFEPYLAQTET